MQASVEVCLEKINELAEFAGLTSVLLKEQTAKLQRSVQDLESIGKNNLEKLNAELKNNFSDKVMAQSISNREEINKLRLQTQGVLFYLSV